MLNIYASSLLTASRFTPFTRPTGTLTDGLAKKMQTPSIKLIKRYRPRFWI